MSTTNDDRMRKLVLKEIFGIVDRIKKNAAAYDAQVQRSRNALWATRMETAINNYAKNVYRDYRYYTSPKVGNSFPSSKIEDWEEAGEFMEEIRKRMKNTNMAKLIEFIKSHVDSSNPEIAEIADYIVNEMSPRVREEVKSEVY